MDKLKSGKSHRFGGGIFKLVFMFMGKGPGIGFTLIFSLAGGLMIGIAGAELDSLRASLYWPHVGGEIITSEVAEQVNVSRDDQGRVSRKVSHSSNVVYRFKVKGKEYTGDRVAFHVELGRAEAEETVAKYRAGQFVRVYYSSENPSNAVLVLGGDEYFYRTTVKIG